jgi:hypothetical protein
MPDQSIPGIILSPQSSTSINPPPIIQSEFLRWLSTPEELFIWIEHNLKGESVTGYDDKGVEIWGNKTGKMVMNDEGVAETIQELRWYVNKFTFHADYKDEQINNIVLGIANSFAVFLVENWRRFDMDPSVFHSGILYNGIINMIFSAYKMSGMRTFYSDVLRVSSGSGGPGPEPKKKILGIIPIPGT